MKRAKPFLSSCGAVLALAGVARIQFAQQPAQNPATTPSTAASAGAAAAADPTEAARARAMSAFLRGDSPWPSTAADAQRSSWVRSDPKISVEGVQKPDFKFLWKVKLSENNARANSLSATIILNKYIGYRGFRNLGFVENNGTGMYGIDIDLGRVEWTSHAKVAAGSSCASAPSSGMARSMTPGFPSGSSGGFGGRGGPAHSGVGQPQEGAVTLSEAGRYGFAVSPSPAKTPSVMAGTPSSVAAPAGSTRTAPGAPVPGAPVTNPTARPPRTPSYIHALSADGMLHNMYVSNGEEPKPAVPFLPANSKAAGFAVVNDMAYAAATPCSGGKSSIVSLDTNSGASTKWDAPGQIAGSEGFSFGPDGTIFVADSSGDLTALDPKTLEAKDTLKVGEPLASTPVIFQFRTKVVGVVATRGGSLVLFDTRSLGGDDHKTPLFRSKPQGAPAASTVLASWMDSGARRWILTPGKNGGKSGLNAWRIKEGTGGSLSLEVGWTSREIASPSAPMVINGIVFVASNADPFKSAPANHAPAVIYALEGVTGNELWNSGRTMTSSAHNGHLSGGNSQIYLGGDDGTLYAFGAWIERQVAP